MDPFVSSEYESEIRRRLVPIIEKIKQENSEDVEHLWMEVVEAFNETSEAVLGPVKSEPTKEWISTATWRLVEERKIVKTKMKNNVHNRKHYNYLCREIKKHSKVDKDTYLRNICAEIEKAHMQKKSKEIYASVRKIMGKQAPRVRIIKDKDGAVLTDQDQVRKRWREHFRDLYNPKTDTDQTVLAEIPVGGRNEEVPATIMREEVEAAIQRLKKNKAPGVDNISAEEIQATGKDGVKMMFTFCSKIWEEEVFPQMWKSL